MALFSKKIEMKYGEQTFENIIDTYEWIVLAAKKTGKEIDYINSEFHFYKGDICCYTNSIKEFKEFAYGISDFRIVSFKIDLFFWEDILITFEYLNDLSLSSKDIILLQDFIRVLENTEIYERPEIVNKGTINSYNINGNQNTVFGDNGSNNTVSNTLTDNTNDKKESKVKEFFKNVFYNISSNIIWYILTAIGLGIAALVVYIIKSI